MAEALTSFESMNGRAIRSFDYVAPEGEAMYATDDIKLVLRTENFGDRLAVWIAKVDAASGVELSRTNIGAVAGIEWEPAIVVSHEIKE